MKPSMIILIIWVIFFLLIPIVEVSGVRESEVCKVRCPGETYEVALYQTGSPGWPFGPVAARVKVLDENGRTMAKLDISVNNDGGSMYAGNIEEVRWFDGKIEVDIRGADDRDPTTYELVW